jgi:hypothetical protein
MSIKKTNGDLGVTPETNDAPQKDCCCHDMGAVKKHCCHMFVKKLGITLLMILMVYIIVWFGTLIRNNVKEYNYIGIMDKMERTIMVDAQGKVTVTPDIGITTMGMMSEAKTVEEAQKKNTEVMNNLNAELKKLGIEAKDIQTSNYNIYPLYDYPPTGGQTLRGYQVSQSVIVKIRDLTKADLVLGLAGKVGINSVSGLAFTFDDDEVYKNEARQQAMQKIAEKAKMLANSLGVRIVGVVSYSEYQDGKGYYPISYDMSAGGFGGGGTPSIEAGTNDVILNVTVTFEIR